MTTVKELVDMAYELKASEKKLALQRKDIEDQLRQYALEQGGKVIVVGDKAKATITQARKLVSHMNQGHLPVLKRLLGPAFKAHVKVNVSTTLDSLEKLPDIFGKYVEVKDGSVAIRYQSLR